MEEKQAQTPEGISYRYFACPCGEEIVNMQQLHDVAEQYRTIKLYRAKVTKWGQSLGFRIPKDLVEKYHFKANDEVALIPEKNSIKVILSEKKVSSS
jgi:hypothetical protein